MALFLILLGIILEMIATALFFSITNKDTDNTGVKLIAMIILIILPGIISLLYGLRDFFSSTIIDAIKSNDQAKRIDK